MAASTEPGQMVAFLLSNMDIESRGYDRGGGLEMPVKNVLFLLVDALRADICYGSNKRAVTPTIDSLMRRGTVFKQAVATTSTTSPSVASIMTGLYPITHGVRSLVGYRLNEHAKTCAEVFKENGYHTYAEVTGPLVPEIGLDRGFDVYICRGASKHAHSEWGDELIRKFKGQLFAEPWFVFIHFWELHEPRTVPKRFNRKRYGMTKYERALSALDAYLKRLLANVEGDTLVILNSDHGEKVPSTRLQELLIKEGDILWSMARQMGVRRERTLRDTGHGFHIYDYLVRVPLIFACEGIFPQGMVVSQQVSQVDIFPTLIEALDLKVGHKFELDGRSVMPLIAGYQLPEVPVFCEACGVVLPNKQRWLMGVRTSKYKFVYHPYSDAAKPELYDIEFDPHETKNIATEKPLVARTFYEALEERRRFAEEKVRIKRLSTRLKNAEAIGNK